MAISALELDTGLSKQSIIRARNTLQQCGRIIVRTRKGNQSSMYQIIPFAYHTGTQSDTQSDTQTDTQADTQADTIPRLEKTRLDKKEKVRVRANKNRPEENRTDLAAVMQAYASNIHPVASSIEKDKLLDLAESYGQEACLKAIERAVLRNKRSLAYIQGILRNWQANGYDEVEHARKKTAEDTSQYDAIPF